MNAPLYAGDLVPAHALSESEPQQPAASDTATGASFISSPRSGLVWLGNAGIGKSTALVQRWFRLHRDLSLCDDTSVLLTASARSRDALEALLRIATSDAAGSSGLKVPTARCLTFSSLAHELAAPFIDAGAELLDAPGSVADSATGGLTPRQRSLADQAFDACAQAHPDFVRTLMTLLLGLSVTTPKATDDPEVIEAHARLRAVSRIDAAYTKRIEDDWEETGLWPVRGVETTNRHGAPYTLFVDGYMFLANGYVRDLDLHIVLGARSVIRDQTLQAPQGDLWSLSQLTWTKSRLLLGGSKARVRVISTVAELRQLAAQIGYLRIPATSTRLRFLMPWPTASDWIPVAEALFLIGQQVERHGADPRSSEATAARLHIDPPLAKASSLFYESLYAAFDAAKVETMGRIRVKLLEANGWLSRLPLRALERMQHVFIDDIQAATDVDLQLVLAAHSRLAAEGEHSHAPSLSGTGDPRQQLRPGMPSAQVLAGLVARAGVSIIHNVDAPNRRSPTAIRQCAELLIGSAPTSRDKNSRAMRASGAQATNLRASPMILVQRFDDGDVPGLVRHVLDTMPPTARLLIIALNAADSAFATALSAFALSTEARLQIERADAVIGSDSEYVLIIGDMPRNPILQSSENIDTLARHAAYTAMTRAREVCIWLTRKFTHGTANTLANASAPVLRCDMAQLIGMFKTK
ncbi:protein of unknown function [Pararobbsia alpina]|uniref:hypothetical protein n=1 Tax=Pararobbsia alpina TaxID=621374 RepID=UPI0039A6D050